MMDANELERAKAYAESIVWRLETLQSRSRYNIDTGKLKRLPTRRMKHRRRFRLIYIRNKHL